MSYYCRFKRADRVTIIWGQYAGASGIVDGAVFQRTTLIRDSGVSTLVARPG